MSDIRAIRLRLALSLGGLTVLAAGAAAAQEVRLICTGITANSRSDLGAWEGGVSGPDWRLSFDPARNSVRFSSNNWVYNDPGLSRTTPRNIQITPEQVKFSICEDSACTTDADRMMAPGRIEINRETGDVNYNQMMSMPPGASIRIHQTHIHGVCRPDNTQAAF